MIRAFIAYILFLLTACSLAAAPEKAYIAFGGLTPTRIARYDVQTNTFGRSIPEAIGALTMVPTPDGKELWVIANSSGESYEGNLLSVFNTESGIQLANISLAGYPVAIVMSLDGRYAYLLTTYSPRGIAVVVFDVATLQQIGSAAPFAEYPGSSYDAASAAISSDGNRLFFSNTVTGVIDVVDTTTRKLVGTIPGGPGMLAVAGQYVIRGLNNQLQWFNTATLAPGPTLQVSGQNVSGFAVSPDQSRLYVAETTATAEQSIIDAVDASTGVGIATQTFNEELGTLAVSPDGSQLAASSYPFLMVLSTTDLSLIKQISTIAFASASTYSPSGRTVYVLYGGPYGEGSSLTGVYDPVSMSITGLIPTIGGSTAITGDPEGRVYVSSGGTSIVDPHTNEVINTVPFGVSTFGDYSLAASGTKLFAGPSSYDLTTGITTALPLPTPAPGYTALVRQLAVSPDGQKLYATTTQLKINLPPPVPAAAGGFGLTTYDLRTLQIVNEISIPSAEGLALNSLGTRAYVTSLASEASLWVLDLASSSVVAKFQVPSDGVSVAVSPDEQKVFMTVDQTLVVLTLATGAVLQVPLPDYTVFGYSISLLPDGSQLLISPANGFNTDLFVFDTTAETLITVSMPYATGGVYAPKEFPR